MNPAVDHTGEVERRVIAIPIRATDCCGFFERREGALLTIRECWYCIHGSFLQGTDDPHQPGFCKFRNPREISR